MDSIGVIMAINWGNILRGAISGGTAGLSTGNPYIAAASALGGGVIGGFQGNNPEDQRISRYSSQQRGLIDQLLEQAQRGTSPEAFEDYFQKAVVDPSLTTFTNRVAPAIQQKFVGTGVRGTPLDDSLARAGADVNAAIAAQRIPALNQFENQRQFNTRMGLTQQFEGQEEDYLTVLLRSLMSQGAEKGTQALFNKFLG